MPELTIPVAILLMSFALPSVQTTTRGYTLTGDPRRAVAQLRHAGLWRASGFTRVEADFDTRSIDRGSG
jgi:Tfp pilus assembly protein FimT